MDFEDKKVRKGLKCAAKRKAQCDNLYVFVRQAFATGSAALLLSGLALLSRSLVPALLSHSGLPTPLLSCLFMLTLLSRLGLPTSLLSCLVMPALSSRLLMPALSSPLMPASSSPFMPALASCLMFGPASTRFISLTLRTFKLALSNEPLGRQSTSSSPPKPFCLFPTLDLLLKKSDCKRLFDTAFITSRLLAANHVAKEVDLSFGEYKYPTPVKLNRS